MMRYQLNLSDKRITVSLDTPLADLLAIRLGACPQAPEAHGAVRAWLQHQLDQANDPNKYDRYNWTASPAELQRMVDQITAAREEVGPDIDICVDMHGRYDAITGEQVAKRLEHLNLMWLEEPIAAENASAYRRITESTSTPICAGENHYLAYGFLPLLEAGA